MNSTGAAEGRFPQGMGEIMLSSNAARVLQVAVGDTVTLRTPSGDWDFTVWAVWRKATIPGNIL